MEAVAVATRLCRTCDAVKPLEEFAKRPAMLFGRTYRCKPCSAAHSRAYRATVPDKIRQYSKKYWEKDPAAHRARVNAARRLHPDRARLYNKRAALKMKFGMTVELYRELLAAQGGVCAICCAADGDIGLAVDHCHTSGAVRGLLCRKCNWGIGSFSDNPSRLRAAAAYLERQETEAIRVRPTPPAATETKPTDVEKK